MEENKLNQIIENFLKNLKGEKGEVGDKGATPKMGEDYLTESDIEELIDLIHTQVQSKIEIPEIGKHYFTPEDYQLILKSVEKNIKYPKDGKDGKDAVVDYNKIISQIMSKVKIPKDGKDGSPDTGKEIVEKLTKLPEEERLSWKYLKDKPDLAKNNGGNGIGYIREASDVNIPTVPTDGQVLTYNGTGKYWEASTPSASSGGINEYIILNNSGIYEISNSLNGFETSSSSLDTAWATMLADISTSKAVITFGVGTFTTTAGLTLANSNIKVRGQGMGVTIISADSGSGVDSTAFFKVDPTQSATGYPLTANANAGDLTITISSANLISSGLAAGDYFILYSSLSIDSEFTSRNQGELHKVISVNTGTGVITIGATNNGTHVYQTMTTANTASVAKLTMYQNISIEGITFTDAATSRPSTLSTGEVLMRFIDNLSITNCQFTDMFNAGLQIQQCMNTKISGCLFRNMKDVTPSANVFYGIVVRGASISTSITNCNFDNMRHGVTQGAGTTTYYAGTTRNMTVSNCSSISTYTSHFDVHQGAEGISFVNNVMVGDDGSANGIQARSPVTITGNSVVGVLGKGISLFGNAQGSVVSGNDIKGCTDGIFVDVAVNKVNITGNSIHDGTRGISLSRTSGTCTISIASPAVITKTAHGLVAGSQVTFSTTGALPTGLATTTVYYVMSTGLTVNSFQISATDGGSAVNTSGSQSGTQTLRYRGGNDSMITNNNIYNNSSVGISTNSQVRVKISGNTFRANSLPIEIINNDSICTAWQIDNNYFYNNTSNTPTLLGTSHYIYGNVGYNLALTAVATPFPASTGNVSNLASAQSFPTSTAVYTNIWSPKIFTITGGTVTVIAINGITTGLTAGSFKLDIGETISVTHSSNPTATVLIV